MFHELIEIVDRQFQFLNDQESPVDFVLRLAEVLEQLATEPRLAAILHDLQGEVQEALQHYREYEAQCVKQLAMYRDNLERLVPGVAPTSSPEDIGNVQRFALEGPLVFDRMVRNVPDIGFSKEVEDRDDPARTIRLTGILAGMIDAATERASPATRQALDELQGHINSLSDRHTCEFQRFWRVARTHEGVALGRLEWVANALKQTPREPTAGESTKEMLEWAFREIISGDLSIREAVFTRDPSREAVSLLGKLVGSLRAEAKKLHEGIRRRIGLRRSLMAVVNRFKNRCEWHDAPRLREIVKDGGSKKEDLLTAEFSKYLYDQGLDPLSRPRTAGLEPDVLATGERSKLYVEAKQYGRENRGRIKKRIQDAAKQILDTVGRLRGTAFEPWEVIMLIFRHGGPRVVLPEPFKCEGITIIPMLIDIAPSSESGSRQRKEPLVITADNIAP